MEKEGAATTDWPPKFNLGSIATALDELPQAIQNRIWREKGNELRQLHDGLPALLANTVNVAHWTWRAVRMLTNDPLHGDLPPKPLAVAVPPLTRALLDSLMMVVFVFDDPNDRAAWYYRAGWAEARELQKELEARHGNDTAWEKYLNDHRAWVDHHEADLGITDVERAKPELATARWARPPKKGWWPNPGSMPRLCGDTTRGAFLQHLNDRYYGDLSQDSHLAYMGLARRGGVLHERHLDTMVPERYRSDALFQALAFYFALLAEVAVGVGLPKETARLREAWESIPDQASLKDLWTARYDKLIALDSPKPSSP